MNRDQIVGARIILVCVVLIAAALVGSNGWGNPKVDLWLFHVDYYTDFLVLAYSEHLYFTVWTKYALVPLVLIAGYGVARFLSIIPPVFVRKAKAHVGKPEGAADAWQ